METHNYQIGIEINTTHINVVLVFQQNKQWQINTFWQFLLPHSINLDSINLGNILKSWRQTLPPISKVIISLPDIYEHYQTIPLSTLISLTPAAYYRLARLHATSYEQRMQTSISHDYRQNNKNLAVHFYNKKVIESCVTQFTEMNLIISAIDIPACALRYLANYLDISSKSSLFYCENKTMYWVAPESDMPCYGSYSYNSPQEQEAYIYQLATKHDWSLQQLYFAGENASFFNHKIALWPDFSHPLFHRLSQKKVPSLIALGLALRSEHLCIK